MSGGGGQGGGGELPLFKQYGIDPLSRAVGLEPASWGAKVATMGGGGGQQTSSTTVNQLYSPEEAARRAKVMSEAERIYGANSESLSTAPYPGAKPTAFSPETLQAQQMLRQYSTGAGGQFAGATMDAAKFGMSDVLYPESNPAMRGYMDAAIRPVTEAYTDPGGVFSNIRSASMAAGGQGTSTRQGIAEGIAGGRYLSTIGDITSKIANEGYSQGLDTFSKTMAAAPQTFALGQQPAIGMSAVGTQQEAMSQAGEDYTANSKMWDLNAPWMPLQNYANIVYGGSQAGTQSTATGPAPQQNRMLGVLGGAAMGASVGSVIPGVGTMVGAGIGALAAYLGS